MDGTVRLRPTWTGIPALLAIVASGWVIGVAHADDPAILLDPIEGANVSWAVDPQQSGTTILEHRRQQHWVHQGKDAEEVRLRFRNVGEEPTAIYRELPASQLNEDLKASLWVRCRIKGAVLALGVTYPHQLDPRSKKPLFAPLFGTPADSSDQWQELKVKADRATISQSQIRLRAVLSQNRVDSREVNFKDAYVDQIILYVPTSISENSVQWDDLTFGPMTAPVKVQQVAGDTQRKESVLSAAGDHMLSAGRPVTPRFITYQGEAAHVFRDLHVNAVWVDRYDDKSVLQAIAGEGLGIFATPPKAPDGDAREKTSLPPFGADTDDIVCWMLGRLDSKGLESVSRWAEQVQDADRQHRPLLGDVAGHVREFHRCVPLLGGSRHFLQTSLSAADYFEFLEQVRSQALPGRPMCTLLQTEASEAVRASRRTADAEPVVEPEQIALATHLAEASGYKLFGFWTQTALDGDGPGMEERRQMLKILNIEMQLLEPWLATGTVVRTAEVKTGEAAAQPTSTSKSKTKPKGVNPFAMGWSTPADDPGPKSPFRATIMRSPPGMLVLVDCLEEGSQFQPGPMAAQNLRFVTMAFDDTPTAYEVTSTSVKLISLDMNRVAGGAEIVLKDFDQHAAIVMSSDQSKIDALKQHGQTLEKEAATAWVALAAAKIARVDKVHQELQKVSPLPDAGKLMQNARYYLQQADNELHGDRCDEARRNSQRAMMSTRQVQRAYWEQAVKFLSSPVASPHAICFQTLPDHWRMVQRLPKTTGENVLRSGDFEDPDAVQTQWRLKANVPGRDPVSLNTRAAQGKYSLALSANPGNERPSVVDDPLITLHSPAMPVYSGQLVRVTGKVLIPRDLTGSLDGFLIYDTLKGSVGAHRFRKASPPGKWQTFEIYRDVVTSGEFQLVFELRGWGEAWLDDIQVTTVQGEAVQTAAGNK